MRAKHLNRSWVLPLALVSMGAVDGDYRLIDAVKNQNKELVSALVRQKIDVNTRAPDGTTALHWAAYRDDLYATDLLLGVKAQVNVADNDGLTPLWLASVNGSGPMVEKLLRANANPNLPLPSGETPLMMAARSGSVGAVKALLEREAAVNVTGNARRQSALMWAAAEGHAEIMRLLIKHGADVNARSVIGVTPLQFAAKTGNPDAAKAVVEAGGDVNAAADGGTNALVVATIRGHIDFAKFLLSQGANPNAGPGFTPLHWAAGANFAEWGTETFALINKDEGSEWNVFHGLAGPTKLDYVKVLLAHGADPNARATRTPRYETPRPGQTGGSAREDGMTGATPVLMAARAGDAVVMRLLVASGGDPMLTTASKTTPLMAAAGVGTRGGLNPVTESRALETVKLCVELGNDVNTVNADGETALHGATYRGQMTGADSIVLFLLDKGAQVNVKNKREWTPLALAEGIYFGGSDTISPTVAAILRKHGAEPTPPALERDGTVRPRPPQ